MSVDFRLIIEIAGTGILAICASGVALDIFRAIKNGVHYRYGNGFCNKRTV
jgi:hypothetical protein